MENLRFWDAQEMMGRWRHLTKWLRAIGLGYPGGPKIDKVSKEGNPDAIEFPRAHMGDNVIRFQLQWCEVGGAQLSEWMGDERRPIGFNCYSE